MVEEDWDWLTLLEKKVRTEKNIELTEEMILSQENQPRAHPTPADIAREHNIDLRWVSRVIVQDLVFDPFRKRKGQQFTGLNIEKHMLHSRKLLSNITQKVLQTAFFSDEKIFKVENLYSSHNNVVYVLKKMRKVACEIRKIILRNWNLSQANNGFCDDIENW